MDKFETQKTKILEFIFDNMELLQWLMDAEVEDYSQLGQHAKEKADKFIDELSPLFRTYDRQIEGME